MNVFALKRSEPNPGPSLSSPTPTPEREDSGREDGGFASLLLQAHAREPQTDSPRTSASHTQEKRLHMQAQTERQQLKRLHAERLQERSAWEEQAAQAALERHAATAARAESIGKREVDAGAARQHLEPRASDLDPADALSAEEDEDSTEVSESRRHSDDTEKALSPLRDRRLLEQGISGLLTGQSGPWLVAGVAGAPTGALSEAVGGAGASAQGRAGDLRALLGQAAGFGGVAAPVLPGVIGSGVGTGVAFDAALTSAFPGSTPATPDLLSGAPAAPASAQDGVAGAAAHDGTAGPGTALPEGSSALNSALDTAKNLSELDLYAPVEVSGMPHAELPPSPLTPQEALQGGDGEGAVLGLLHRVASRNGDAVGAPAGGPEAHAELGVLDSSRAVTSLLGNPDGLGAELGSGKEGAQGEGQGEVPAQASMTTSAFDTRLQAFAAGNRLPTEATDLASRLKEAVGQTLAGVVNSTWEQKDGLEHVSIALNDPELGRIQIELSLQDGKVKLELFAEQELARHALQDHRKVLEQELSRQQYTLEQFKVSERLAGNGMRDGRGGRASTEAGRRAGRGALGQVAAGGMAGSVQHRAHEGALDIIA